MRIALSSVLGQTPWWLDGGMGWGGDCAAGQMPEKDEREFLLP